MAEPEVTQADRLLLAKLAKTRTSEERQWLVARHRIQAEKRNNALAVELRAKFGAGEFYVNGDTFDLIFRPAGGSFASFDKIVARMACGESAFSLPQIVAGMLNAALEGDE